MSDIVFILGAGASRQCGAPLMSDFLEIASDLLRSDRVSDKRAEFEQVFHAIGALQVVHSKSQLDLNNIESIFTVLELSKIIRSFPGYSPEHIETTINALKYLIVRTLEEKMAFPPHDRYGVGTPEPYDEFGQLILKLLEEATTRRTVSIITFNYDIAADMALVRLGLGPDYVISPSRAGRRDVQLLKLHGSLNWATECETRRIRPLYLDNYFQTYSVHGFSRDSIKVPISTHLVEYFSKRENVEVEPEPVIVPPSWNKADYHKTLSDVWAAAASHLSEAQHIFIMGYSLPDTDSFFRHLYALGSVGKAPLRSLQVFNPDESGGVESRFRMLLGPGAISGFRYHPMKFDQGIAKIADMFDL